MYPPNSISRMKNREGSVTHKFIFFFAARVSLASLYLLKTGGFNTVGMPPGDGVGLTSSNSNALVERRMDFHPPSRLHIAPP